MKETKCIKAYGIGLYKVENERIKLLLCKSVKSFDKWGFLKGIQQSQENSKGCAKREFMEECSINIKISIFEAYFEQLNKNKNIGIWLVNAKKVKDVDKFFDGDKLYDKFLSRENSEVKYFELGKLPKFKKKQEKLILKVKDFLENKIL